MAQCPTCNGTGRGIAGGNCMGCGGKGELDSAHHMAWAITWLLVAAVVIYLIVS